MGALRAFALVLVCGCEMTPDVKLHDSGLLTIAHPAFAPTDRIDEMAQCVVKFFGVPSFGLSRLSIEISHGYAVTCAGELMAGCYLPRSMAIKVPSMPVAYVGGFGDEFTEILIHELTHWALHLATGKPDGEHLSTWFRRDIGCGR